jgi:hypothetical protein
MHKKLNQTVVFGSAFREFSLWILEFLNKSHSEFEIEQMKNKGGLQMEMAEIIEFGGEKAVKAFLEQEEEENENRERESSDGE